MRWCVVLDAVAMPALVSGCAQQPIVMVPLKPEKYASHADMQREKFAAGARCEAMAMNAMGPAPIPQQQPANVTNVALAAVIVNNSQPRQDGVWDFGAVNRSSQQVNYQFPADNTDWNAVRENQLRWQRANANFFGCMADAGFIRAPGQ